MIFQILTAISAFTSLLLAIYAFNMEHSKNTVIFAGLMLQISVFTSGSFMELMEKENTAKIFWRNISQIGFLLAIPTLLVLVIVYIGKENVLKPINVGLIYLFPVTGIVLRWTDRYSHLMRDRIYMEESRLVVKSTTFGLFIIMLELINILLSVILLLGFYKRISKRYKKQTLAMVIGILIPLSASVLKLIRPGLNYNLTFISITFTLTGIILFWSIFRYQLFSIVPVARDKIMDCIQEGIITIDHSGIIIDKNSAADRFITDTVGAEYDIAWKKLEDLLLEWPRWYLSCKNMQEDEFEIDTLKWGKKRYYYVKVYPLYKYNYKKRGSVSILIDITDRKIREEELVTASELNKEQVKDLKRELSRQKIQVDDLPVMRVLKGEKVINFHFIKKDPGMVTEHLAAMNSLKDKLFTVFTHDIRNPVATMVSLMELLADEEGCNEEWKEILKEVKKQINYTYNIIENLLDWLNSQREGLRIRPYLWNLAAILEETIAMYLISAGVKGIQINCTTDENIKVFADKEMLKLVLRNLLSNAVKFTNQGGKIIVEAYETGNETIIAVKDTGIGMDNKKVQNLFHESFASSALGTAGEKGIGLGLLICKEFIMKNGGKIWVESIPGKGSNFFIALRAANKI